MGFWDSYNAAYGATKTAGDQAKAARSQAEISGALANGDYNGAAQAAYRSGNFQSGALFMQQGQQQKKAAALGALTASFAPHPTLASALGAPVVETAPAVAVAPTVPAGPADPNEVTVTAQPKNSAPLYDLTKAPQHGTSPETATAAQAALAAGVPMETITQAISLGHQLDNQGDAARIQHTGALTKIAQQALGIDVPGDPEATATQRKNFVATQISNTISDPNARAEYLKAASTFDYGDANLTNFVNQQQSLGDVINQARQDAGAAQKQANTDRAFTETARHNRAGELNTANATALSHADRQGSMALTRRGQDLRRSGEGGYAPISLGASPGSSSLPAGFTAGGNADDE